MVGSGRPPGPNTLPGAAAAASAAPERGRPGVLRPPRRGFAAPRVRAGPRGRLAPPEGSRDRCGAGARVRRLQTDGGRDGRAVRAREWEGVGLLLGPGPGSGGRRLPCARREALAAERSVPAAEKGWWVGRGSGVQWGSGRPGGLGRASDGLVLSGRERLTAEAEGGGGRAGASTQGSAMEGPARIEEATTPLRRECGSIAKKGKFLIGRGDNQ